MNHIQIFLSHNPYNQCELVKNATNKTEGNWYIKDLLQTCLDHHVQHSTRVGDGHFRLLGIFCLEHIIFWKCSRQHTPNSIGVKLEWTPEQTYPNSFLQNYKQNCNSAKHATLLSQISRKTPHTTTTSLTEMIPKSVAEVQTVTGCKPSWYIAISDAKCILYRTQVQEH